MSKRFLFLFSDTGGGHRSGALAVAQAMNSLYGDAATVTSVDVFADSQQWPFSRFPRWYPSMLKARGAPWKVGFELTDHPMMVNSLTTLVRPYFKTSFRRLLANHPADVIVSFHPIPNRLLALESAQMGLSASTATVVLDYLSASAFWFAGGLHLYVVPYAEMTARAARLSASPFCVEALGMPVRQQIRDGLQLSPAKAKALLGVDQSRPLALVLGGGDGVGPLERVVYRLLQRRPRATVAVIAGRNQHLRQRLIRVGQSYPLRVEGFTQRMDLWLRAADILVTKAGPNTLAEAFVMGLPTVLYTAIPGQEEGNVALVRKYGAGVWAPGPRKSVAAVMSLLDHPAHRKRMARQARSLATPDAAEGIASRLWRL